MSAIGTTYRARDDEGWRVPDKYTMSGQIYRLAKKGYKPGRVAVMLKASPNTVRVLLHRMRHPEQMNEVARRSRRASPGTSPA
jgi:hypothetical protein